MNDPENKDLKGQESHLLRQMIWLFYTSSFK
jgi:hypothetical protein